VNDAVASQPYSTQLAATGGKPPYTWSIVSPDSATISLDGVFTDASGFGFNTESFTVRVTDVANKSSKKTFVPRVFSPLVITTTALPTAIRGVPFSCERTADGGLKPYTWSDYKQSVPSWMSLNAATGAL